MTLPNQDPDYVKRSFEATAASFCRFLADLPPSADRDAAIACNEVAVARARAAVAKLTGDLTPLREAANQQLDTLLRAGNSVEAVTAYLETLEAAGKQAGPTRTVNIVINARPYVWDDGPIGRDDVIDLDADEDIPLRSPRERYRVMIDRPGEPPQYLHPGERVLPSEGMVFHVTSTIPGLDAVIGYGIGEDPAGKPIVHAWTGADSRDHQIEEGNFFASEGMAFTVLLARIERDRDVLHGALALACDRIWSDRESRCLNAGNNALDYAEGFRAEVIAKLEAAK